MRREEEDEVWLDLRAKCADLRSSRGTERKVACQALEQWLFHAEGWEHRLAFFHRLQVWGMVCNQILHLIVFDLFKLTLQQQWKKIEKKQSYSQSHSIHIGISKVNSTTTSSSSSSSHISSNNNNNTSSVIHSQKIGNYTSKISVRSSKIHGLEYMAMLRKCLDSLESQAPESLSRQELGRDFLKKVMLHILEVLEYLKVHGRIDTGMQNMDLYAVRMEYWSICERIVQRPSYCRLVDGSLEPIIPIVLSVIKTHATHDEVKSCCQVLYWILANVQQDLYDWLEEITQTISDFVSLRNRTNLNTAMDGNFDVISRKLIQCLNCLMLRYEQAMLPYLVEQDFAVLQYVQRSWKTTSSHLRDHPTEFLIRYLQLISRASKLSSEGNQYFHETVQTLYTALVNVKELAKAFGHSQLQSSNAKESRPCALNRSTALYMALSADLIHYMSTLKSTTQGQAEEPERHKRQRTTGVMDQLVDEMRQLLNGVATITPPARVLQSSLANAGGYGGSNNSINSINAYELGGNSMTWSTTTTTTTTSTQRNKRKTFPPSLLPWLVVLNLVLRRHPTLFRSLHRAKQISLLLSDMLEAATDSSRAQEWIVQAVAHLGIVCIQHRTESTWCARFYDGKDDKDGGEEEEEPTLQHIWHQLWYKLLRPDLAFNNLTAASWTGSLGHLVIQVLTMCVHGALVSSTFLTLHQDLFFQLSIFRNPRLATNARSALTLLSTFLLHVSVVDGRDDVARTLLDALDLDACLLNPDDDGDGDGDGDVAQEHGGVDLPSENRFQRLLKFVLECYQAYMALLMTGSSPSTFYDANVSKCCRNVLLCLLAPPQAIAQGIDLYPVQEFVCSIPLSISISTDEDCYEKFHVFRGLDLTTVETDQSFSRNSKPDHVKNSWHIDPSQSRIAQAVKELTLYINSSSSNSNSNNNHGDLLEYAENAAKYSYAQAVSSCAVAEAHVKSIALTMTFLIDLCQQLTVRATTRSNVSYGTEGLGEILWLLSHMHNQFADQSIALLPLKQAFMASIQLLEDKVEGSNAPIASLQLIWHRLLHTIIELQRHKTDESTSSFQTLYSKLSAVSEAYLLGTFSSPESGVVNGQDDHPTTYGLSLHSQKDGRSNQKDHERDDLMNDDFMNDGHHPIDFDKENERMNIQESWCTQSGSQGMSIHAAGRNLSRDKGMTLGCISILLHLEKLSSNTILVLDAAIDCVDELMRCQVVLDIAEMILLRLDSIEGQLCNAPHECGAYVLGLLKYASSDKQSGITEKRRALGLLQVLGSLYMKKTLFFHESLLHSAQELIYGEMKRMKRYRCLRKQILATLQICFRLHSDAFPEFVEQAILSTTDEDFHIRSLGCEAFHSLFYEFPDATNDIFHQVYTSLTIDVAHTNLLITGIMALMACALSKPELISFIIFRLCCVVVVAPAFQSMVCQALKQICLVYEYDSMEAFLSAHLVAVVRFWLGFDLPPDVYKTFTLHEHRNELHSKMSPGYGLKAFPFTCFHIACPDAFIQKHLAPLVPWLIFHGEEAVLLECFQDFRLYLPFSQERFHAQSFDLLTVQLWEVFEVELLTFTIVAPHGQLPTSTRLSSVEEKTCILRFYIERYMRLFHKVRALCPHGNHRLKGLDLERNISSIIRCYISLILHDSFHTPWYATKNVCCTDAEQPAVGLCRSLKMFIDEFNFMLREAKMKDQIVLNKSSFIQSLNWLEVYLSIYVAIKATREQVYKIHLILFLSELYVYHGHFHLKSLGEAKPFWSKAVFSPDLEEDDAQEVYASDAWVSKFAYQHTIYHVLLNGMMQAKSDARLLETYLQVLWTACQLSKHLCQDVLKALVYRHLNALVCLDPRHDMETKGVEVILPSAVFLSSTHRNRVDELLDFWYHLESDLVIELLGNRRIIAESRFLFIDAFRARWRGHHESADQDDELNAQQLLKSIKAFADESTSFSYASAVRYHSPWLQLRRLGYQIDSLHEIEGFSVVEKNVKQSLVYSLLAYTREVHPTLIRLEAADCLGRLGAMDMNLSLGLDKTLLQYQSYLFYSRKGLGDLEGVVGSSTVLVALLPKLVDSLFAGDSNVVQETIQVLYDILEEDAFEAIQVMLQRSDAVVREYLCGFAESSQTRKADPQIRALVENKNHGKSMSMSKSKSKESPFIYASKSNLEPANPQHHHPVKVSIEETRSYWCTQNKTYNRWITALVSNLARYSSLSVIKKCSSLCNISADIATMLFPYVVYFMLQRGGNEDSHSTPHVTSPTHVESSSVFKEPLGFVREWINERIHEILSWNDETTRKNLQCQQLVIHTLLFLKEINKQSCMSDSMERFQVIHKAQQSSGNGSMKTKTKNTTATNTTNTTTTTTTTPRRKRSLASIEVEKNLHAQEVDSKSAAQTQFMLEWKSNLYYHPFGLVLDYLHMAQVALLCHMPVTAIQCIEVYTETNSRLASLERKALIDDVLRKAYGLIDELDCIYGVNENCTSLKAQLMTYEYEKNYEKCLPCYNALLHPQHLSSQVDGALGLKSDVPRINDWKRVGLTEHTMEGLAQCLQKLGYQHLLQGYLHGLTKDKDVGNDLLRERHYEVAWRNSNWNLSLLQEGPGVASRNRGRGDQGLLLHESLYHCLRSIALNDSQHFKKVYHSAKIAIIDALQHDLSSFENSQSIARSVLYLEFLTHVREVGDVQWQLNSSSTWHPLGSLERTKRIWKGRQQQLKNRFDSYEELVALSITLFHLCRRNQISLVNHNQSNNFNDDDDNDNDLGMDVHESLYCLTSQARESNRPSIALASVARLENGVRNLPALYRRKYQFEKAKVLWSQGVQDGAIRIAKDLCTEQLLLVERIKTMKPLKPNPKMGKYERHDSMDDEAMEALPVLLATLSTVGTWLASQRSESSQSILDNYLSKAVSLVTLIQKHDAAFHAQVAQAHLALADYMAEMYAGVEQRVQSREWLIGKKVASARQSELDQCLTMNPTQQSANRMHIEALRKEVVYDQVERDNVEASVDVFRSGALLQYEQYLKVSRKPDLTVVFQVVSLWFNNAGVIKVNELVEHLVQEVASYKFVPLCYQIMTRLGTTKTSLSINAQKAFARAIESLVHKLCLEHPHHSLPPLMALRNGKDVAGRGAIEFRCNVGDEKVESAAIQLKKLVQSQERGGLVQLLEKVCNAYIDLALFDTSRYHNTGKTSAEKLSLNKVTLQSGTTFDKCLRGRDIASFSRDCVPVVLTFPIEIASNMDYSALPRIHSFDSSFSITESGIHRPKIIHCIGSNGKRYKQLVKGHDDTRQDLVIEQVFETVNVFLKENKATQQRKLRLSTYKVVPLSPIAGVLEWVANTIPLGDYLVAKQGKKKPSAHERYHPHEWRHVQCRNHLKLALNKDVAYQEIMEHFTPVFHHYFLEQYPDPSTWLDRRTAYVRSVASTSIVGHILGIGDRHSQNVLIQQDTGELVHIDFGVVFDQGMALFTPETVPFRLTRDMVDGMGVAACQGIFEKCCQEAMKVLRAKSSSLLTILEVVMHDPLYRWTLSPLKALRYQQEPMTMDLLNPLHESKMISQERALHDDEFEEGRNDSAARALIRIKQKLQGYEDPHGNAMSVEGQVKRLIASAQDPRNLCRLYPGWAPWL